MVWAGIINEHVIGPYFFDENVSAQTYLTMLREFVLPDLARLGYDPNQIWYMHDGAPAHATNTVRKFLTDNFLAWIGRGDDTTINWPPRSPDLTPMDFFVWGFIKNLVNQTQSENIHVLQNKIEEAMDNITVEMLENTHAEIEWRLKKCINVDGNHFENL